jgi:hypothetical protein
MLSFEVDHHVITSQTFLEVAGHVKHRVNIDDFPALAFVLTATVTSEIV